MTLSIEHNNETYLIANPYYSDSLHCILISIGAYASDRVLVFSDKSCDMCDIESILEEALEEFASDDWDCSEHVQETYQEYIDEGKTEEEAYDLACSELTAINGGSHWISDWYCGTPDDECLAKAIAASNVYNEVEA